LLIAASQLLMRQVRRAAVIALFRRRPAALSYASGKMQS
jgi:hypothetical protein